MLQSLERSFVNHVNKWAGAFRENITSVDFDFFSFLMGVDEKQQKTRKAKAFLAKALERQIAFVNYFATCLLFESATKANFESTKKIVSLQCISQQVLKNENYYMVFFHLSKGRKVFLVVNDLNDIDFADVYSGIFFEAISIGSPQWKYLTKTNLNSILKIIRKDMASDQYIINFEIPEEYAPNKENNWMYAHCMVEGELGIDKIVKIKKTNTLFGMDVLEWFEP